ncbi:MAG: hypothetical protein QOJ42_5903 [Acidobacteriaceae bacterium]|nr:hypothetical protein [Acidobacteriaceae bacterium]
MLTHASRANPRDQRFNSGKHDRDRRCKGKPSDRPTIILQFWIVPQGNVCRKSSKFCEAILEACSANSNASSRGDRSEGRASGGSSLVLSGALSSQEHLVVHAGDTKQGGLPVRSLKEQTVCSTGNLLRHHEKVLQYLGGRLTQPDQIQPKGRHGCAQSTHLASGHLAAHQHLRQ